MTPRRVFKIASEDREFEAIHRLNHATFVEEIPQHAASPDRRLVDRFHGENTYFICLDGETLAGMVALRSHRPYSLDEKLPDVDSYLPQGRRACEIRLLAIDTRFRRGGVLRGLLATLIGHARRQGLDLGLISGTTRQMRLYEHLGFVPFGPLVGVDGARFQPMYVLLEDLQRRVGDLIIGPAAARPRATILLTGPVPVRPPVRRALGREPISHRSDRFLQDFRATQEALCRLTGAEHVAILLGSGTMANDMIAGQLGLLPGRGLILVNGEFGERLTDHARRFGLEFETCCVDWGLPLDPGTIRRAIERSPGLRWIWAVHCETSTGILNDMGALRTIARESDLRLCLDCVSSIGTVPVDLRGIDYASGVSGKGLASFPGLSMVFHNHAARSAPDRLPRCLDLGLHAADGGVPFTHSSNLLHALQEALCRTDWGRRFEELAARSRRFRRRLREAGLPPLAPEGPASPAVVTLAIPPETDAQTLGRQMEDAGFVLGRCSAYLRRRNWIQIGLMGECSDDALADLVAELGTRCGLKSAGKGAG